MPLLPLQAAVDAITGGALTAPLLKLTAGEVVVATGVVATEAVDTEAVMAGGAILAADIGDCL